MKMMNNYILCEDKDTNLNEHSSGFETKSFNNFKKVKVIRSNEEDVPEGSMIKVSVSAGTQDEDGLYIKRGEIVAIL